MDVILDVLRGYGVGDIRLDRAKEPIKFIGKTGMTWASFGQTVQATIEKADKGFLVSFQSGSGQITDWGRGDDDRRKLADLLLRALVN